MSARETSTGPEGRQPGMQFGWVDGFELWVSVRGSEVVIAGNAAGLLSLAQHLVTLAADTAAKGSHLHLDQYNGLEPGSAELILERAGDSVVARDSEG